MRTRGQTFLRGIFSCAIAAVVLLGAAGARAQQDYFVQNPMGKPEVLKQVGFDQRLNNQVPLDLTFRDEKGRTVALRDLMEDKPAILTLVYYQCPMLCTETLNATLNSLKEVPLSIGKDFSVLTVSIDPSEKPILADAKHIMYAGLYGRPGAASGWHFLTGDEPQIQQLAASVGYRFVYDKDSSQFAHPAGIVILTPEGKVSRYFYGISYPSRDVRLGLVEASEGRIGSLTDTVLLYCFHYDPHLGKYSLVILNVVRGAGVLTVIAIVLLLAVVLRRGKHSAAPSGAHRGAV
jgi:protein SCO1